MKLTFDKKKKMYLMVIVNFGTTQHTLTYTIKKLYEIPSINCILRDISNLYIYTFNVIVIFFIFHYVTHFYMF